MLLGQSTAPNEVSRGDIIVKIALNHVWKIFGLSDIVEFRKLLLICPAWLQKLFVPNKFLFKMFIMVEEIRTSQPSQMADIASKLSKIAPYFQKILVYPNCSPFDVHLASYLKKE